MLGLICGYEKCSSLIGASKYGGRPKKYCCPDCREAQRLINDRTRKGQPSREEMQKASYKYQMERFDACKDWYKQWASTPLRA